MLNSLSDIGFTAVIVGILSLFLIILQAAVSKRVWGPYILIFMASFVVLMVTLR